jgi:hypothetical protein
MLLMSLFVNTGFSQDKTAPDELREITVHRSPTCGCCSKWLDHIKQNGYKVNDIVTDNVQSIKDKYGVTAELSSCHTAIVGGYVIEGHVPAGDINKLLESKAKVSGLTVPGMPKGTPGMEMGGKKEAFEVFSFNKSGQSQLFSQHKAE